MLEWNISFSKDVEISRTKQDLLTTYGKLASTNPTGKPTNSSAPTFNISVIFVSHAKSVTNLAEYKSTISLCNSAKLKVLPPTRYNLGSGGSFQV